MELLKLTLAGPTLVARDLQLSVGAQTIKSAVPPHLILNFDPSVPCLSSALASGNLPANVSLCLVSTRSSWLLPFGNSWFSKCVTYSMDCCENFWRHASYTVSRIFNIFDRCLLLFIVWCWSNLFLFIFSLNMSVKELQKRLQSYGIQFTGSTKFDLMRLWY